MIYLFCYVSRWSDISNVINHKKEFIIESVGGIDKAEFLFSDVESAKNAWRFCVLQHMFFRQYELNNEPETYNNKELPEPPAFQQEVSYIYVESGHFNFKCTKNGLNIC